jgi:hypothetical protein
MSAPIRASIADMQQHTQPLCNPVPWLADLIAGIDRVMKVASAHAVAVRVEQAIRSVIFGEPATPAAWRAFDTWRPSRREIYRSSAHGYQIVALTLAPGQASFAHDLGSTWAVYAPLEGAMEVTEFVVAKRKGAMTSMRTKDLHIWRRKETGTILRPLDIHATRNPSEHEPVVALAVYGRALDQVNIYAPHSKTTYRRQRAGLGTACA